MTRWRMALMLLPLALAGCPSGDDDDSGGAGDDDTTGGTLEVTISEVTPSLSETIATVVSVTWTTDPAVTCYVEYGAGDDTSMTTPLETAAATGHEAILLGLPAASDVSLRIVAVEGNATAEGDVVTFQTGSLPADLPALSLSGTGHDGFLAVPVLGAIAGATIISPDGEFVWYWLDDRDLDVYRVRLSVDGRSVLYNAASVSGDPADDSVIVRVALDGSEETTIAVPLLAHDFVEHADGTLGALAVEYREYAGEDLRGDQIVEVAPDGTQSVIWSSWDCFDPAETEHAEMSHGWTFANALDFDADADAYYVGMRNFSSIAKVDRGTGACEWVFGDTGATFEPAGGSASFMHQHQFQVLDGAILVFDNDGAVGSESRVLEYTFDPGAGLAEEAWSYVADPTIHSFVLGDVNRFGDGDTLVTWSVAGQIERVTAAGEVTWQLNSDLGYAFGFDTVLSGLYTTP